MPALIFISPPLIAFFSAAEPTFFATPSTYL